MYHNIPAISASGINTFLNDSPLHYWKHSPFNPNKKDFEPTASMEFGTLCHLLLLENEKFSSKYAIEPECDRRTKEGKEIYSKFFDEAEGKKRIKGETFTKALNMIEALKAHPAVFQLLKTGFAETEIFWKDKETGLDCKSKLDYARDGLVVDYKTTQDASKEGFQRSLVNFGYHRQDMFYRRAYKEKYNKDPIGMLFIVQDVNEPEAIGIYNVDENARMIAEQEINYAMKQIKERLETNNWSFTERKAQTVNLPAWYNIKGV